MRIILRSRVTGDTVLEQEHSATKYAEVPEVIVFNGEYFVRAGVADNRVTFVTARVETLQREAANASR